ncbi:Bcr/CflA family drug resistance transporter [Proteus hauseri ATCC 700826]|uniref:Bcr/CflA family drug resistance transporter n=1 Tax=Proteus hauseri ATCC 700826 TaxID=1354271 RepID=A0AAJ3LUW5_PROHU|nr:MFS transporter [Proteus hauseri]OAT48875.1 Bcr/CflA family drug resistance transporter [Proteus hauseri ATCC 700826]
MKLSIRNLFYLICFSALLGSLAQNIYTPVIPLIQQQFNTTLPLINLTVSAFTFTMAIMQLFYGSLIDKWGRKPVLLCGLFISIIGALGCFYSYSIGLLIFWRVIQAIGIAAIPVVAVTILGDLYQGNQRAKAMGSYQMLLALAPACGPLLGGYLAQHYHYQGIFAFLALTGVVLLIIHLLFLPETRPQQNIKFKSLIAMRQVFLSPTGRSIFVISFMVFYNYFCLLVFLPLIAFYLYRLNSTEIGGLYVPMSIALILGSYLYRKVCHRFNAEQGVIITSIINLVALGLFALFWQLSLPIMLVLTIFYGLSLGLTMPTHTTLLANTFSQNRATAMGMYNFIRYCGMAAGPMVAALFVVDGNYEYVFYSCVIFTTLALFFTIRTLKSSLIEKRQTAN